LWILDPVVFTGASDGIAVPAIPGAIQAFMADVVKALLGFADQGIAHKGIANAADAGLVDEKTQCRSSG